MLRPLTHTVTDHGALSNHEAYRDRRGYRNRLLAVEVFARSASGEQGRTPLRTSFHEELGGADQRPMEP